ncbi:MAG TPA: 3-hydroxyacyl-CoA dehydrogenase family protein [Nitriliruptorales bacterium]
MQVSTATVVGAGVMGAGIAQVLAIAGVDVRLHDRSKEALDGAAERVEHGRFGLRRAAEIGKLSEDPDVVLARISRTADLEEACAGTDLVVEAVFEDYPLKIGVFGELDRLTPEHAILASNTSGLSIAALAAGTRRPERVIGWHWASPAPAMKLAEIVVHGATDDDVRDTVVELAARCGKNPEVVRDTALAWGFVANRVLMAVFREADTIVREGVAEPAQVDQLLKDCFRWPVGPFEMRGGTSTGWEERGDDAAPPPEQDIRNQLLRPQIER